MITSANVAGVPVPLGSKMPRKRPGEIKPGIRAVGALGRRKTRRVGGLVRVESFMLDEAVGMRFASLLGKAGARGAAWAAGQAAHAVGHVAKAGAKKAKSKMSPAMRHKLAVMGGKAAALKRGVKKQVKAVKKAHKKRVKAFAKSRLGKATAAIGKGLRHAGGAIHAAYKTAKAQEAHAKIGKALKAAKASGNKDLIRALSMMQQGMQRGDSKRVRQATGMVHKIARGQALGRGKPPTPETATKPRRVVPAETSKTRDWKTKQRKVG